MCYSTMVSKVSNEQLIQKLNLDTAVIWISFHFNIQVQIKFCTLFATSVQIHKMICSLKYFSVQSECCTILYIMSHFICYCPKCALGKYISYILNEIWFVPVEDQSRNQFSDLLIMSICKISTERVLLSHLKMWLLKYMILVSKN